MHVCFFQYYSYVFLKRRNCLERVEGLDEGVKNVQLPYVTLGIALSD